MPYKITGVREIISHSGVAPCFQTSYGQNYVSGFKSPAGELAYTMGDPFGWLYPGYPPPAVGKTPLWHPQRFADRINAWTRPSPFRPWQHAGITLDKRNFPWMSYPSYLEQHPEVCVGSTALPSVVPFTGVFYMAVCATVSDPFVTTAGHAASLGHTPYMLAEDSRANPWSYFVLYIFASIDGLHWNLINQLRNNDNLALASAAVYYEPHESDLGFDGKSEFQGISGCSMVYDEPDGYFYILLGFNTKNSIKSGIVRSRNLRTFEIWHEAAVGENPWVPLDDGRLPQKFNDEDAWGVPFSHVPNQLTHAPTGSGKKFMMTILGAGFENGSSGIGNCVEITMADKIEGPWERHTIIQDAGLLPSYDGVIKTPSVQIVDPGFIKLWISTNADLATKNSLCPDDSKPADYAGLRIVECDLVPA